MQASLIDQGISLMLYGMGTVFAFLTLLVFATALMSRVVNRFSSSSLEEAALNIAEDQNSSPSPKILQAIQKAIAEHRAR